jgi:8-oxo-dGTP diphosphatase
MKKVEVVAGIVYCGDSILCVQRPWNKLEYISEKYEFPGGKVEALESMEEALNRELSEELDITTNIKSHFLTVVHSYPDFELTMHSFICEVDARNVTLNEHIDHKWLELKELMSLDWAAADIPIVEKLISNG